uniref:Uncharacterized protein n=1 Tax=Arundo donax TaxID=35708 RepID=A0A0A9AEA2_ARUDO
MGGEKGMGLGFEEAEK